MNHGELVIPRKDGTTTHIPEDFFMQTASIDVEQTMLKYAEVQPFTLIQTTEDEVIGETNYASLQGVAGITIHPLAADHNFTAANRQILLQVIEQTLLS